MNTDIKTLIVSPDGSVPDEGSLIDDTVERGLGDTVANLIHKYLHLTPCSTCQRRRRTLNRIFPYKSDKEIRPD